MGSGPGLPTLARTIADFLAIIPNPCSTPTGLNLKHCSSILSPPAHTLSYKVSFPPAAGRRATCGGSMLAHPRPLKDSSKNEPERTCDKYFHGDAGINTRTSSRRWFAFMLTKMNGLPSTLSLTLGLCSIVAHSTTNDSATTIPIFASSPSPCIRHYPAKNIEPAAPQAPPTDTPSRPFPLFSSPSPCIKHRSDEKIVALSAHKVSPHRVPKLPHAM